MQPAADPLKSELLTLEREYWTAIKHRDAEVTARLSADPCLVVGAQGVIELDRQHMARMMEHASYELKDYALDRVHMHRVSDDVVALAYQVNEDLRVEGQDISLRAYDMSVWARRNGQWVCVLHTESPAGDPFGRH
jgi:hypothetical protein